MTQNIQIQLVRKKICIEADPNFSGASTRIIAYVSLELENGIIIDEISVRQDTENRTDIRVVYPFRKVHDEIVSYINFTTEDAKNALSKYILTNVVKAMENTLSVQNSNNVIISK